MKKVALSDILFSFVIFVLMIQDLPPLFNIRLRFFSVLAFFIYMSIKKKFSIINDKNDILLILGTVFFNTFSMLSIVWSNNFTVCLQYTFFLIFHSLVFLIVFFYLKEIKDIKFIFIPVFLSVITVQAVCIWEMKTFNHLPGSELYKYFLPVPTGTFYNRNMCAWMLILTSPAVLYWAFNSKIFLIKCLAWVSFFLNPIIIVVQSARLAIFTFIIYFGIIFVIHFSRSKKIIFLATIILLLFMVILMLPKVTSLAFEYVKFQFESLRYENISFKVNSLNIRKKLYIEGVELFSENWFKGTGAGNFMDNVKFDTLVATLGTSAPHNFILEIIVSYGIIGIFLLFLIFIMTITCFKKALMHISSINYYTIAAYFMLNFFLLCILPSTIMRFYAHHYIIFAVCLAIITRKEPKQVYN
ncbi:MAG: hypothetical protein CSB55_03925 [Candidatus Cloacimonadota bacterium]|nr:MAG: hypothetical protein CSB55_03925 [Candidatus Cloacimonadota bacterium]